MDYKEYARIMRTAASRDENGNIICSPELWEQIANVIESIPTAEVVRCKGCQYANDCGTICRYGVGRAVEPEHFCSYGERKEIK